MSGLAQSLVGSALLDTDLDTLFSKTISAQKPTLLGNKRKKSTTGPDNAKKPKKVPIPDAQRPLLALFTIAHILLLPTE